MKHLVKLHGDTDLGKMLPVYDGRRALYTAGLLPFTSKDFTITLTEDDNYAGITKSVITVYLLLLNELFCNCLCFNIHAFFG